MLQTIPWDKVDIEVIITELIHAGKVKVGLFTTQGQKKIIIFFCQVFSGSRIETIKFLESKNYLYIGNLFDDIFVRKDLFGNKYKVDLDQAKKLFPLFSTELVQDREKILDKYSSFWDDEEKTQNGDCLWKNWFTNAVKSYSLFQNTNY